MPLQCSAQIKIMLAHQHPIVCVAVRAVLATQRDYLLVEETGDGAQVVPLVERLQPKILLIDANMLGGVDMIHRVLLGSPRTRVVVLATAADEGFAAMLLRHGAAGLVLKGVSASVLPEALRETAAGRRYVSPPLTERIAFDQAYGGPVATFDTLTPREREILQLSAEGHTAAAIAELLSLSPRTVEKHRANLSAKLGIRTQADVVRYALRHGIVEEPRRTGTRG